MRSSNDSSIVYLAHLFRGGIAARNGRQSDARQAYQQARRAGPGHQTACVALSQIEAARGDLAQARTVALECLALRRGDDPWWSMGALDPNTPDWLHSEVRR